MDSTTLVMVVISILFVFLYHVKSFFIRYFSNRLPPGPKPKPIFGNIFDLGEKPHRSFANLAKIFGPLISLKLGNVTTVVVSSSYVAEEMFLKNDQSFANRTIPDSVRAGNHDKLSMSWLPISPQWRNLRKISAVQLLSTQRLDASQALRQAKVSQLHAYVQDCSKKLQPVNIGRAAFTTSLNLLSNTFFSIELASHESSTSQEFKQLMWNIMEEIGRPNYADYFPILGYIDPFGIRRRLASYFDELIVVFQNIICERQNIRSSDDSSAKHTNDVLDTLLNLYDKNELSMDEINHLLVDIFNAGTDTTASTLEWTMTELIKNPKSMIICQNEIEQALGKGSLSIQESDISKLPYLQAIMKETLRLHPPTVFLLPRKADSDVELCGYVVPKHAQVLVNLWAIGRDPKVWENPEVFSPERFLDCEIDLKGQDFELLPFGAGRRICPGLNLAYRMLNLMLATLLHNYNWKLEDGMTLNDLDMDEKFGITLQKVKPLQVVPIPRY
ncbi:cytochrome P450 76AD1-like [Chenopodium quinoa]|uniref:cytochrome P450 76AD1-like n=1 Tax=Chenopodium quinoa TaxID=63459 RepID=UPI000B7776DA|nr:cytochrome P450 76AD1-like [Chenopodium quinoa]